MNLTTRTIILFNSLLISCNYFYSEQKTPPFSATKNQNNVFSHQDLRDCLTKATITNLTYQNNQPDNPNAIQTTDNNNDNICKETLSKCIEEKNQSEKDLVEFLNKNPVFKSIIRNKVILKQEKMYHGDMFLFRCLLIGTPSYGISYSIGIRNCRFFAYFSESEFDLKISTTKLLLTITAAAMAIDLACNQKK